jgi:hypothetical protein
MKDSSRRSFVKTSAATGLTFTFAGLISAHGQSGGGNTTWNPEGTFFSTNSGETTTYDPNGTYVTTDPGVTTTWDPDQTITTAEETTTSTEITTTTEICEQLLICMLEPTVSEYRNAWPLSWADAVVQDMDWLYIDYYMHEGEYYTTTYGAVVPYHEGYNPIKYKKAEFKLLFWLAPVDTPRQKTAKPVHPGPTRMNMWAAAHVCIVKGYYATTSNYVGINQGRPVWRVTPGEYKWEMVPGTYKAVYLCNSPESPTDDVRENSDANVANYTCGQHEVGFTTAIARYPNNQNDPSLIGGLGWLLIQIEHTDGKLIARATVVPKNNVEGESLSIGGDIGGEIGGVAIGWETSWGINGNPTVNELILPWQFAIGSNETLAGVPASLPYVSGFQLSDLPAAP